MKTNNLHEEEPRHSSGGSRSYDNNNTLELSCLLYLISSPNIRPPPQFTAKFNPDD